MGIILRAAARKEFLEVILFVENILYNIWFQFSGFL